MPEPQMKNLFLKYDVALSFAEEDREFVDCVARRLKDNGLKIFYDDYERIRLWGSDLHVQLDDVYRRQARFCVLFVSGYYKEKRWTNYELRSALIRALKAKRVYILPFQLDGTVIPELNDSIIHLDTGRYDCSTLATAIVDKIAWEARKHFLQKVKRFFSNKYSIGLTTLVAGTAFILGFSKNLTSVETLTRRLHEESKHVIHGSICRDKKFSRSRGPGTCSSHGGVERKYDSVEYRKTWEECRKEAEEISWLDP